MAKRRSTVVPDHVTLNIEAVANLRALSESEIPNGQRAIESLTIGLGRPRTLMMLIAGIAIWTVYNCAFVSIVNLKPLDPPPFYWLQGFIGLYAALMTTMILTTQNRQNREAEKRAHLELQVSLLAEQRTAHSWKNCGAIYRVSKIGRTQSLKQCRRRWPPPRSSQH
jgi:uncharacterized membrane protein